MGIKMSIYFSMQADPVDYGIWKTGIDTAGSLSAINGFIGKVAQAVAGGLSGILIAIGGYQGGSMTQNGFSVVCNFKYVSLYSYDYDLISMLIMSFYKLDYLHPQIQNELSERRLYYERKKSVSYYRPLLYSAWIWFNFDGSGIIVGIVITITVWQKVLNLSAGQVGLISSLLTFSIAAGSLLAGNISKKVWSYSCI